MGLNMKDILGGQTFEDIPSGRYAVRIDKAELSKTSEKNDIIKLIYKITDGKYDKRIFFDQAVLTANSLWKLKTLLSAIGSSLADSSDAEIDDIIEAFKNKELSVYVEVSKNEDGKTRFQCSGWQPLAVKSTPKVTTQSTKKVNILD
jgi:hypothetical protein